MIDISELCGSPSLPAAGEAAKRGSQARCREETFRQMMERAGLTDPDGDPCQGAADVADQIADPDSQFYQDMFQRIRIQWEQSEEDKKEQAIIDALGAILDGMRSTDGVVRRKNPVSAMANLSREISKLDKDDPRRMQLDLFRQRLGQLGIFVDLDLGVRDDRDKDWQTLTQRLISEENASLDPSIFDLI